MKIKNKGKKKHKGKYVENSSVLANVHAEINELFTELIARREHALVWAVIQERYEGLKEAVAHEAELLAACRRAGQNYPCKPPDEAKLVERERSSGTVRLLERCREALAAASSLELEQKPVIPALLIDIENWLREMTAPKDEKPAEDAA